LDSTNNVSSIFNFYKRTETLLQVSEKPEMSGKKFASEMKPEEKQQNTRGKAKKQGKEKQQQETKAATEKQL